MAMTDPRLQGLAAAEAETLVLAARISLSPEEEARFQGLLDSGLDWDRLVTASLRLRVYGLLYKHLSGSKGCGMAPSGIVERLEQEYRVQTVRSLALYGQIARILDVAGGQGIDVLLLKGAWLARWVYRDPALRPFDDIDLLCREEDVPGLSAVLRELGYRPWPSLDRSRVHARMFSRLFHHLPPFDKPGGARVELHTSLVPDLAGRLGIAEAVWRRALGVAWDGRRAYVLSPEDQVFHLSSHLAKHLETGALTLAWFCDIHEVVRAFSQSLDWGSIAGLAAAARNERRLCGLWRQLSTHWGTPIPGGLTGGPVAAPPVPDLPALIGNGLDARPEAGTIRTYARYLKEARGLPSARERLVYLWKQVFPDGEYLRLKYRIPEGRRLHPYYSYHLFVGLRSVWRDLVWMLRAALKP